MNYISWGDDLLLIFLLSENWLPFKGWRITVMRLSRSRMTWKSSEPIWLKPSNSESDKHQRKWFAKSEYSPNSTTAGNTIGCSSRCGLSSSTSLGNRSEEHMFTHTDVLTKILSNIAWVEYSVRVYPTMDLGTCQHSPYSRSENFKQVICKSSVSSWFFHVRNVLNELVNFCCLIFLFCWDRCSCSTKSYKR